MQDSFSGQDAFGDMELMLGSEGVRKLSRAKIAVFGVGSVGSYIVEALARCGVASLTLVDGACISMTGINRQLYALRSTVGRRKVLAAKGRIRDIDENILVNTYETFYNEDTAELFELQNYDYIVDAMDEEAAKLLLIQRAKKAGVPVISCMGTKNRMDPSRFEIADISQTSVCLLAKRIRTELKKKGIRKVKVLFSKEKPLFAKEFTKNPAKTAAEELLEKGSISFVSGVAGMMIAGEVIRDLLAEDKKR